MINRGDAPPDAFSTSKDSKGEIVRCWLEAANAEEQFRKSASTYFAQDAPEDIELIS